METSTETSFASRHHAARQILRDLGIPVHRVGYKQLCMAVALYAGDNIQYFTKELYPQIAHHYGYEDWRPVEHAIRLAIGDAWHSRTAGQWVKYFPVESAPPSNKQFIATVADYL